MAKQDQEIVVPSMIRLEARDDGRDADEEPRIDAPVEMVPEPEQQQYRKRGKGDPRLQPSEPALHI